MLILYTVRKVCADFAVYDLWRYCKDLCDVKFSQIEGNGRKFCRIELSYRESSDKFSNSIDKVYFIDFEITTIRNLVYSLSDALSISFQGNNCLQNMTEQQSLVVQNMTEQQSLVVQKMGIF